ncbi:MAG: N-acetyltransferase [Roseivirga sp.]|nr:N-acetyltransferase [Roseivirga sp.]
MSTSFTIGLVEERDIPQILDIYKPFVLTTATSFETEVPALDVFTKRVLQYARLAPWLVARSGDTILGYAYATAHRSRGAYRWNQETTVYVHPDHRKKGIARALYEKLLHLLTELGYTKALAVITLPNDPSIGFHQSLGFKNIGEMNNIGFKFNRWHNTSWWDKDLQDEGFIPGKLKPLSYIENNGFFSDTK